MMIPPLVRVGPLPPDPGLGQLYVVLTPSGWDIVRWYVWSGGRQGNPMLERYRTQGSLIYPANVICWMPADGS